MSNPFLWSLVLALHLLSMAYWIGGGFSTVLTSRSTVTLLEPAQRHNIQIQIFSRYFRALLHVIPLSLISGWLLIIHMGGFDQISLPINIMQGLALIMALLFVSLYFGPFRTLRRAIRPQSALFEKIRLRVTLMLAIGIVTVVFGAIGGGL